MKNKKLYLRIFAVLIVSFYSCDSDPCDDGYTEVTENGSTFCLPDYVAGIEKQTEYGNRFYHNEYGIIAFDNGKWTNPFGENLKNIEHNE